MCLETWTCDPWRFTHSPAHTQSSYLSERLQHLCGLILLPLLGHQHHLLDHADSALVRRRRPTSAQPVSWLQHEWRQDVSPLLGRGLLPAVLRACSPRLLAFGLLCTHGAVLLWTVIITRLVPMSSRAQAVLITVSDSVLIKCPTNNHIFLKASSLGLRCGALWALNSDKHVQGTE